MPITNPTQLVDQFKKSGEFDRLRRELLAQFQREDGVEAFKTRVDQIARQRLQSDQNLQYMPQETVHRELMQEIDRYPVVERTVADVRMLSDPSFATGIRNSIQRILLEDRGQTSKNNTIVESGKPKPSQIDTEAAEAILQLGRADRSPLANSAATETPVPQTIQEADDSSAVVSPHAVSEKLGALVSNQPDGAAVVVPQNDIAFG